MTVTRTVTAAAALGNTVVLPAHSAGDMILLFAYRTGTWAPAPKLASGWSDLIHGGTGFNCERVGYKIAESGSEACGVWADADAVLALVYHTDGRWKPPRISQRGNAFGSDTILFPDLAARLGASKLVRIAGHRTATNMLTNLPDGWTAAGGLATRVRAMDADAVDLSAHAIGADAQAVNAAASYRSVTISLADAEVPDIDAPLRQVWDKIPAAATVLTLTGLNFNLYNDQPLKFRGLFAQSPYVMKKINYPASLFPNSIPNGIKALDAALLSTAGSIIVLAQSQGAQVCSEWMDKYAGDATREALASRLVFLLTGNPLRSTGNGGAIGEIQVNGEIGEPTRTDTPWPIVDFARRWDGWADQPDDTENAIAMKNAKLGKSSRHMGYNDVDLYDDTHTVWTVDNTTYVLTREELPPLLDRVELTEDEAPKIIATTRQMVEAAYVRPYEPTPVTAEVPSAYWAALLTRLGVK